ncbi:MAG: hypothetical protein AB8G86_12130 [Saprospiraceae bacterium]
MKNWKSLPVLLMTLVAVACLAISCGEDREVGENTAYVVDIEIITPANNTSMAVGENFNVEVDYAREENIIHNIKVEIVDAVGNQVKNLVNRHAHVPNEFTFTAENISISEPGTYTLRAATTDLHEEGAGNSDGDGPAADNLVEYTIIVQ